MERQFAVENSEKDNQGRANDGASSRTSNR